LGLFVLAAWPLALVDVPPFQDLPNHLAAATILLHRAEHPGYVFNGFFKTNSALFTWLVLTGPTLGVKAAARVFTLAVLALQAIALPRFVLAFGGRRRMAVSAAFAWPMVHHWFVSMGMLDFALGLSLATFLLIRLRAYLLQPSAGRAVVIGLLALATWFAHVFPLLVVHLLVALEVASRASRVHRVKALVPIVAALLPSSVLSARAVLTQWTDPVGPMSGYVDSGRTFSPPWELFYNLWAEWSWAFTWREIATLVPCITLGLWAIYRWRQKVVLFGPTAIVVLAVAFSFSPYVATNWAYLNSRFIPFLWLAALARAPVRLPKRSLFVLGACALSYSIGMGVDYGRLGREWGRFAAGMGVVPRGSSLLPLVFQTKIASENTRSLTHAWGLYVVERDTTAPPLLFAHSRSFPLMFREPPPAQFHQLVLEGFAPHMKSPDWLCTTLRSGGFIVDDCARAWRDTWAAFWRSAAPRFDRVLLWAAPSEVVALLPPEYRVVFRRDELLILARSESPQKLPNAVSP
jgi:hypothetical protein